jgi:two-component system sensor histidine kinase CiaH
MFEGARLKLTAWYVLIIMIISIGFSVVIFDLVSREVQRFAAAQRFRIQRLYVFNEELYPDVDLMNEVRHRLILTLLGINGGILIVSGGLAFVLAGKTLKPIGDMVEEQNQFISDASHELRTPLTSMKSAMEVSLRDKELGINEAREIITGNIEDVDKLQALSDHLLQLAQYQKPDIRVKFEKVPIVVTIQGVVKKVMPMAKIKKITIDSSGVEEVEIKASKYSINDLLVILLDNAIKYSPRGKTVSINAKRNDGSVIISVTDEGMGIAEKDLPHIFERFYRADVARSKEEVGGYGLGLSIAKKIVDLHRGNISVKSKVGGGSTFTIKLPAFS